MEGDVEGDVVQKHQNNYLLVFEIVIIGGTPQQARLDSPGTLHHVMIRGIKGRKM